MAATSTAADLRVAAAGLAEAIAVRLTTPEHLLELVAGGSEDDKIPLWQSTSLAAGASSLAVLFGELANRRTEFRRHAHQYLQLAAGDGEDVPADAGFYTGTSAIAFAARLARRDARQYAGTLAALDTASVAQIEARLIAMDDRPSGEPRTFHEFDVIRGLSGLGRYLLMDPDRHEAPLRRVLAYLATLVTPRRVDGTEVPGWWVDMDPSMAFPQDRYRQGHLNLGMAHGVCGPLALMALALRAGVCVPDQRDAMTIMSESLLRWRHRVEGVVCWPGTLALDELRNGYAAASAVAAHHLSWCYGAPGIARALQLAGSALGRSDIVRCAVEAVESLFSLPGLRNRVWSLCVCHGLSGLLQCVHRVAADDRVAGADAFLADMVSAIVAAQRADAPFRYRFPQSRTLDAMEIEDTDDPGLLNGAAGVALALWSYHAGVIPATRWDAALLLS